MGRGAALLGLQGKVTREQFDAIRQGLDPSTGDFLRPRHSADKFDGEGKQIARARNLYDFTISAPKALSVQALEDPRLLDAHDIAVAETAKEMESLAARRSASTEPAITVRPRILSSRGTTMTPAGNSIRRFIPTWSREISPMTASRAHGRRSRPAAFMSSANTSRRCIATPWRAR